MNIFLSWSGDKSKKVANLLNEWLPLVIQVIKPWVSTQDIESGKAWHNQIQESLSSTSFGIFCLTQENKDTPWILYEAGAISKGDPNSNVCCFLIDLKTTDLINNPLSSFNNTFNEKESIFKLIKVINNNLQESKLQDDVLKKVFEKNYPDLEGEMQKILKDSPVTKKKLSLQEQTINEILTTVRKVHYNILDTKAEVNYLQKQNKRGSLYTFTDILLKGPKPSYMQKKIDLFVSDFVEANGRFPTNEEIQEAFKSKNSEDDID